MCDGELSDAIVHSFKSCAFREISEIYVQTDELQCAFIRDSCTHVQLACSTDVLFCHTLRLVACVKQHSTLSLYTCISNAVDFLPQCLSEELLGRLLPRLVSASFKSFCP